MTARPRTKLGRAPGLRRADSGLSQTGDSQKREGTVPEDPLIRGRLAKPGPLRVRRQNEAGFIEGERAQTDRALPGLRDRRAHTTDVKRAETEGFEPSEPLRVLHLSRVVHSTGLCDVSRLPCHH